MRNNRSECQSSEDSQFSGRSTWPWERGFPHTHTHIHTHRQITGTEGQNTTEIWHWHRDCSEFSSEFSGEFVWTYTYLSIKKESTERKSSDRESRESVNWKRMCLCWLLVRDGPGSQLASTSKALLAYLERTCSRLKPALITQGVEGPLLQLRALTPKPFTKGP